MATVTKFSFSSVGMNFVAYKIIHNIAYDLARVCMVCRDCWPIFDKKQESQFRKACSNWLAKIAKVGHLGTSGMYGGQNPAIYIHVQP